MFLHKINKRDKMIYNSHFYGCTKHWIDASDNNEADKEPRGPVSVSEILHTLETLPPNGDRSGQPEWEWNALRLRGMCKHPESQYGFALATHKHTHTHSSTYTAQSNW